MTYTAALAAGAVLGMRHALEADHLAAVATLVDGDSRPGYVGVSWGVGHSIPIIVLGFIFVGFGIRLPSSVTKFFEVVVGIILLFLAVQMLWSAIQGVEEETHNHGERTHSHLQVGSLSVGLIHSHVKESSFLVGAVHGFAGSGALVIALVSTAPTIVTAASFLVGFSVLSIVTMTTVSFLWGQLVGTRFTAYLEGVAGIIGIGISMLLLVGQIGLGPL